MTAALTKVFAAERPTELQLKAKGYEYVIWGGVAVTVFVVERTPELMRLHQKVIDALAPFSVSGGTGEAFVGTGINAETIGWVETFVPKSSGQNYLPHVTLGVAKEDFAKQLKAETFESFSFKPNSMAIYQLGNFGTAAKKLWQYQTTPLASWNDGKAKQAILDFVRRVTTEGSPDFVPALATNRRLRQRWDALGRTAVLFSGTLCFRPGSCAVTSASGVERQTTVQCRARKRHEVAGCRRHVRSG